jgi:hypothetical protein
LRIDIPATRHVRRAPVGNRAHDRASDGNAALLAVEARMRASARAQLEDGAAIGERPNPCKSASEIFDKRVGTVLKHQLEIGRPRQRESDSRCERSERAGVILGLLTRSHFLLQIRGSLRSFVHLGGASQAGDDEKHVFEDDPGCVFDPAPLARD